MNVVDPCSRDAHPDKLPQSAVVVSDGCPTRLNDYYYSDSTCLRRKSLMSTEYRISAKSKITSFTLLIRIESSNVMAPLVAKLSRV